MLNIELSDLRVLMRVAESGSFSRTALILGLSQPSVSRIVGKLEQYWSGKLFYRTGRGVTLTEFGREAAHRATEIIRAAEQVNEDLRAHSRLPSGSVSIAMPPSIMVPTVPQLVNDLRRDCPGIRLEIFEGFSEQTENWLSEGIIDIGVYNKYYENDQPPTGEMMGSRLVLAGLKKKMKFEAEIDFTRLGDFDLVLPARTNGLRAIVDTIAKRLKVTLNVIVDADSTLVQKELATTCGCLMVKAQHTIYDEVNAGLFGCSIIREPYINRHVVLTSSRKRPLSRAGREVTQRLTKILRAITLSTAQT